MRTRSLFAICASFLFFLAGAAKADLPPGPGLAETVKLCGKCHDVELSTSLRQTRAGWEETVSRMINLGMEGTDQEFEAVLTYLSTSFAPEPPRLVDINKATAAELETGLGLTRAESDAVVQYRTGKGDFKSIDDLKNVPGLDFKKIEARKARLKF